jgi:hypothetical protein
MARRKASLVRVAQASICHHCAEAYIPNTSWQRFCGPSCKAAYRRTHKHGCPVCGKKCRPRRKPRAPRVRHVHAPDCPGCRKETMP